MIETLYQMAALVTFILCIQHAYHFEILHPTMPWW